MATNLRLIREVTPRTVKWTTKVQVIERPSPRSSAAAADRKFQRLILEDTEHTQVQATIFGPDIEIFRNTLLLNKKYHISNAMVRDILPSYRIVPGPYQWTINAGTLVEEITEDTDNEEARQYNFIPFSNLRLYNKKDTAINILAIAVHIYSPRVIKIHTQNREATIQELLLITQELKPITLTFWDQFISNECITISNVINSWPVVQANRVKVVKHNDEYHLSTQSNSCLLLEQKIPEATSLRSWSAENKENIDHIIQGTPPTKRIRKQSPTEDLITDIATATRTQPKEAFWIKASASIVDFKQNFWYIGCSNCYKTIYAEAGKIYNCLLCNQHEVTAEPRCRFEVELHDFSGITKATCLGRNAEKLFHTTTAQLKEKTSEAGIIDTTYLTSITPTENQTMLLKPYEYERAGTKQQKLTIIAIENEETKNEPSEGSKGITS